MSVGARQSADEYVDPRHRRPRAATGPDRSCLGQREPGLGRIIHAGTQTAPVHRPTDRLRVRSRAASSAVADSSPARTRSPRVSASRPAVVSTSGSRSGGASRRASTISSVDPRWSVRPRRAGLDRRAPRRVLGRRPSHGRARRPRYNRPGSARSFPTSRSRSARPTSPSAARAGPSRRASATAQSRCQRASSSSPVRASASPRLCSIAARSPGGLHSRPDPDGLLARGPGQVVPCIGQLLDGPCGQRSGRRHQVVRLCRIVQDLLVVQILRRSPPAPSRRQGEPPPAAAVGRVAPRRRGSGSRPRGRLPSGRARRGHARGWPTSRRLSSSIGTSAPEPGAGGSSHRSSTASASSNCPPR